MMRLRNHIYGIALAVLGCCVSLSAQTFQNLSGVSGTLNGGLFSTNLAWGDYDGDGLLDLYSTNWGTAVSNPINALFFKIRVMARLSTLLRARASTITAIA